MKTYIYSLNFSHHTIIKQIGIRFRISNTLLVLCALVITIGHVNAQVPKPASPQEQPTLIYNGIAHIGNGEVIENSAIAFDEGKITLVADARTTKIDKSQYIVIDAGGKHVYPGLILPSTQAGLMEILQLRQTRDFQEVGQLNPNVRALVAYNTDSELLPTFKFNGIQIVQTTPWGGLIAGTSSVMQLDAWNWEDAAYKVDDGIHLYWPSRLKLNEEGHYEENPEYDPSIEKLNQFFADALAYSGIDEPEQVNLKLEAATGIFDGTKQLYLHVSKAKEIINAIKMAKKYEVQNIVLVSGTDTWYVKDFIKENNVPVLIFNMHELPSRRHEDVDLPFKLPGLLMDEGVLVGLAHQSGMLSSAENLAFGAGTAAAYGLTKEEALQLMTLNNARILGIEGKTGTIAEGKDANLVVSDGDLLDMKSNHVIKSYIQGRSINLEGKQQKLYERFKEKYESTGILEDD